MAPIDYPADVRAEYPERSSRLWAVLTIVFLIKIIALLPHGIILIFLAIAQFVVALVAQFVVAFRGDYPAGMHDFVTGVLRWQTRVYAFALSVDDRYPPFSLQPQADYPVDVAVERPAEPSRTYAVFTIIVQIIGVIAGIWFAVWLVRNADTMTTTNYDYRFNFPSFSSSGLLLRQLAAIPHYIILAFLGIAVFVIWVIVQWVILFVARFPFGMWEIVAGFVRWSVRVNAYALGLVDRYPPFSFSPSLSSGASGARPGAPPPPPPPMTSSWPTAPAAQAPQPQAPPPPVPPQPPVPAPETPPAQPSPTEPGAAEPGPAQPEPPHGPTSPASGA